MAPDASPWGGAPDVTDVAGTKAPLIAFRGLVKHFGSFRAVDDLSLDIGPGEFFALVGPSGCGKTTLLRLLAGFETPTAGKILIGGLDMSGVPPHRRPVNMMFQSYALFPHMSVQKNIAFGLVMERLPQPAIAARVAEMLDLVKLEPFARRMPHQLSGGQRQRVALARALAKRPKVLLLDEPLSALDKKLREETRFELTAIQARLGTTFVIVTHDQEEAMTVADRVGVMAQGKLAQVGTPTEIYEQPNCRYVADFIGDINLLSGNVSTRDGTALQIEASDVAAPIRIDDAAACRVGDAVWFAIRPEKVTISTVAPPLAASNAAAGEVVDIAYIGNTSVYRVRLASGRVMLATVVNSRRVVERQIARRDNVWLSWTADAGLLLTR